MFLEDAFEEYKYYCLARNFTDKTMKNKHQEYKQLKKYLTKKRSITKLEQITHHDLKAYVYQKQKSGLQPQSIVSMAKQIIAFFNWCVKEEYLMANPMDKVTLPKVPKKTKQGFTEDEVYRMIRCWSDKSYLEMRGKTMVAMMADLGLRAMEVRGMTVDDIRDTTILIRGKGNKERVVFASHQLKRILVKYERIRKQFLKSKGYDDPHYFLNYKGDPITHATVHNIVKEAADRTGVKDAHPHKFRHFYSTEVVSNTKANMDIYSLSRLLGHADISTTQRYLQSLTDEKLKVKANSSSPLSKFRF
ncbi:tyrosine-type recombinase/integrase [Gracilibacillus caseinilyticus]|uniref:Tyrosine-type recombinase/integrase n=1 Tax=Gracilibacillus caseinilyticus TaxID=2932256 RepID=A0ABY4F025_9BACI|nr:tyrosine-type recombinase/integrase [Gracilibacillus caseinilyticus]UOQ47786.1 tyrosine-type recombinase/integrase [Gracilibacillus caseinilyticus]